MSKWSWKKNVFVDILNLSCQIAGNLCLDQRKRKGSADGEGRHRSRRDGEVRNEDEEAKSDLAVSRVCGKVEELKKGDQEEVPKQH